MSLRLLCDNLFLPAIVDSILTTYVTKHSDYGLAERFDNVEMAPTYNAACNTIDLFHAPGAKRIPCPLELLLPLQSTSEILILFEQHCISHGHVFDVSDRLNGLLVYYLKALTLLPPHHAAMLVCWKRAAFAARESMLASRARVWHLLWHSDYKFKYSMHPALFTHLCNYKGPMPLFVQQVSAYLLATVGGQMVASIYTDIVCKKWLLSRKSNKKFLTLWNDIIRESAIVYLPTVDSEDISALTVDGVHHYLLNSDKFLALLLLLFNEAYQRRFTLIDELPPHMLAELFNLVPSLAP